MSAKSRVTGGYISLYLAQPIYLYVEQEAKLEGIGLATWVRNVLLDACPEGIRISAGEFGRGRRRPAQAAASAPQASQRPTEPPQTPATTRKQRAEA
jgi:hypothetical protein